uniref:ADAM 17-like protease n=1 Tax=Plectus sambesii TaxID=2011161 RepID=A0A914V897_9BILA
MANFSNRNSFASCAVYFIRIVVFLICASSAASGSYFSFGSSNDGEGNLSNKLNHYELVYVEREVVKRGAEKADASNYNRIERVSLYAFNRPFRLYLTPKRGLLDPNLKAAYIDADGKRQPFHIDQDHFYEGHLHGSPKSRVSATFDGESSLTASVETDDETFVFEPAWRHIPSAPQNAILAYRASDVKVTLQRQTEGAAMCGFVQIDAETMVNQSYARAKREAEPVHEGVVKNRCPLKVVADYRFYETIGNRSTAFSARYLINMIDRVNALYTQTDWGVDSHGRRLINMGFMIREMIIHARPTLTLPGEQHYNMQREDSWGVAELLNLFAAKEGSGEFCLVHLFTSQSFSGGVLGLGFIAGPSLGSAGGICTAPSYKNSGKIYFNTALSSAKSTYGDTVITREADIVTAHEFGHNWGSYHDPSTEECSPSYQGGGSYIMHTYSVTGYDKNNKLFSPCSQRMVGAVLSAKSSLCFAPEQDRFCGNGRVENGSTIEENEQCDVGSLLSEGVTDKCCTTECKLKPGAQCSPKNSPCCTEDCKFMSRTTLCLAGNALQCKEASYCTGYSGECPEPFPLPDGENCFEGGECQGGHCVTFCERKSIGRKPCICSNPDDSCYRCCRSGNGRCAPYLKSPEHILRNGTRCIHGYCDRGVCLKEVTDVVSHLWSIIDKLDRTTFWKFVEDNLVLLVIIISLIFWIPASIIVNYLDQSALVTDRIVAGSDL